MAHSLTDTVTARLAAASEQNTEQNIARNCRGNERRINNSPLVFCSLLGNQIRVGGGSGGGVGGELRTGGLLAKSPTDADGG